MISIFSIFWAFKTKRKVHIAIEKSKNKSIIFRTLSIRSTKSLHIIVGLRSGYRDEAINGILVSCSAAALVPSWSFCESKVGSALRDSHKKPAGPLQSNL
jgi:hypothetical protein